MSDTTATVSGAREWAANSCNVIKGCSHRCIYCYAHGMAARFGRLHPEGWGHEVKTTLPPVGRKFKGSVMVPSTHDLTPENADWTLEGLRRLLAAGNQVLVVSKPHLDVVARICTELAAYRSQVLFRFTIGAMDSRILAWWEPGAPTFEERLMALEYAHAAGWATSVSMEPLLEVQEDRVIALVEAVAPFVTESIWIGKLNRGANQLACTGNSDPVHMEGLRRLQASQFDERIRSLVARVTSHPAGRLVKWKESVKAVMGDAMPTRADDGWAGQEGLVASK